MVRGQKTIHQILILYYEHITDSDYMPVMTLRVTCTTLYLPHATCFLYKCDTYTVMFTVRPVEYEALRENVINHQGTCQRAPPYFSRLSTSLLWATTAPNSQQFVCQVECQNQQQQRQYKSRPHSSCSICSKRKVAAANRSSHTVKATVISSHTQ